MSMRWTIAVLAVAAAVVAGLAVRAHLQHRPPPPVTFRGAVLVRDADPRKQAPIAGVTVTAETGDAVAVATTDFSGYFAVRLPGPLAPGEAVTLQFRQADYRPLDLPAWDAGELYVARLAPTHVEPQPASAGPEIVLSDLVVRYSVQERTATNVGSAVKAFQVVNSGNEPCLKGDRCSPDRRWKAAVGGVSLDAGADNEFRSARLSCIAGPCPFTRIDSDQFSKGGRRISATVRDWSDTTTFVLEAEVFRPEIVNTIQQTYPIVLGRRLNFTLPPAAEGPAIEAEENGQPIVFPLDPKPVLSWATCEVRTEKDQTHAYRCELKPGYTLKSYAGS